MIRLHLSDEHQADLRALRRDKTLTPLERDRVEMVALNAAGWPALQIAEFLDCHPITVRKVLTTYQATGAVPREQRHGPPPALSRRTRIEAELRDLLAADRTWTAAQLAAALVPRGIDLQPSSLRRYLQRMGARYRRTVRTVSHLQDAEAAAKASTTLGVLANRPKQAS